MHNFKKWSDCLRGKSKALQNHEDQLDHINTQVCRTSNLIVSELGTVSQPNNIRDVYTAAPLEANNTRIIRLLPHRETNSPINCELFEYDLSETTGEKHLYEALSYVWGSGVKSKSIMVNGCAFSVTDNLHAALWHLRDRQLARVLWVDAICINQENISEKERQIPLMCTIYAQAKCVIVWLGAPIDNGDEALQSIHRLAQAENLGERPTPRILGLNYDNCLTLLQRDWFHRIWILQEVGVARSVTVMCGSVQVNGHAFCEGLGPLELSFNLPEAIHPVVQLIKRALYRPKYEPNSRGSFSLGELIDMYGSHRATVQHDIIYALLGLSTDGPNNPDLKPNYALPWHKVFKQATRHIFGPLCTVETWPKRDTAVIKGKCLILGQVVSVNQPTYGDGQIRIRIQPCNTVHSVPSYNERGYDYSFHPCATAVREGDIVCHLQGSKNHSIIRFCNEYLKVIKTTAIYTQSGTMEKFNMDSGQEKYLMEDYLRDIVATFTIPLGHCNGRHGVKEATVLSTVVPEYQEELLEEKKRLNNIAIILEDIAIAIIKNGPAAKALKQLIEDSGPNIRVSEKVVEAAAGNLWDAFEIIQFLFEQRGTSLPISEEVVEAAAANSREGYAILQFLFQQRGKRLPVSENVFMAAAGNKEGCDIMKLLLEQRGRDFPISEEIVKVAAGNYWFGYKIMRLLFDQRGDCLPISEAVVRATAANSRSGYETMQLLFKQRKNLPISEEVVKNAAGNRHGYGIMQLLFEQQDDLLVSEGVIKAAAGNTEDGYKILVLFLEKRGENLGMSKEVLKATLRDSIYESWIMRLMENQAKYLRDVNS